MVGHTPGDVDPYNGNSTRDAFFLRVQDLKFGMVNYLNCTCIMHTYIIRHYLSRINCIFRRNPDFTQILPLGKEDGHLVCPSRLPFEQAVASPIHSILFHSL